LIAVLLIATGFLVRLVIEPTASAQTPASPTSEVAAGSASDEDFSLLAEIAAVLERDFVDPSRVSSDLLIEGSIQGLFDALNDPHSTYIDPQTYALSRN